MTCLTHVTNPNSLTNAADETTEFGYDEVNRLILSRDPLNNETQYRYDGLGNRVATIDAEAVETRYDYDDLNRLASVIENYQDGIYTPAFPDQDVKTTYTYDAVGNRLSVTDANTHTTSYTYDRLNRQVAVRDPLSHTIRYGYDAVGNRTVLTDAKAVVTTFSYDKVNRPTGIDYADSTPDVSFSYDLVGNRRSMSDGSGTTLYTYDPLYRLATVQNGAGQVITYTYDAVGNRTGLVYPEGQTVGYTYDDGNRLTAVTDWQSGQFGYTYDEANRLTTLALPNGITSSYGYDAAGRLTLLSHRTVSETLASYAYSLDQVGNRTTLTETLLAPESVPVGAYLESEGSVVMEAEKAAQVMTGTTHAWQLSTSQSGYTGTAYLQGLPDTDALYQTAAITGSPAARYPIDFTTPGTYTLWLRGYPSNAAGDSAYLGLGGQVITVTGVAPAQWSWGKGQAAQLVVPQSGLYTLTLWLREDGLRVDRLLLTTDTTYLPTGFGPVESMQQTAQITGALTTLARTINYSYDDLYRLTQASYTNGESYQYTYDPVGNRLQQIINGDTTTYLYDAANRLTSVDGVGYTYDDNGNLLTTGTLTNTWDAANRLIETTRAGTTLQPSYDGLGNRVGQTVGLSTTTFALDVQGLPEVISTSAGNAYLHLPGVIMTENATGTARYLLSDGLGSVRQATDESGAVVAYHEFDPYGNPVADGGEPYGYTGEWWEGDVGLLHLRARWYLPEDGVFLSRDPVEGEPTYLYARGNPVNGIDPSGRIVKRPEVGTKFMYSCNCGWIDWSHASVRDKALKIVRDAQTADVQWPIVSIADMLFPQYGSTGEIMIRNGIGGERRQREVALGIFISVNNLFEAFQGTGVSVDGQVIIGDVGKSSYSEEDLMSNLIGFHRAVGPIRSKRDVMKVCDVVAAEFFGIGVFKDIHRQIFDEYGPFQKVYTWGAPRLGGWTGSITNSFTCQTYRCNRSAHVPSEYLSIEPKPPLTGDWMWISAHPLPMLPDSEVDASYLNSVPLNWAPTGR